MTIVNVDAEGPSTEPAHEARDPRVESVRHRLNEALLEADNGEYFRSRVHGLLAYRADAAVELPEGVASRLSSSFSFERPAGAADVSTLDAFVLAYHAAESLCRQVLALIEGSGPLGSPLVTLTKLKAGRAFNNQLSRLVDLPDEELSRLLDYLFLPVEVKQDWGDETLTIASVQDFVRLWVRWLAHFVDEWRNPYNAAKHGLAVVARPGQLSFMTEGSSPSRAVTLMDGPILETVEHETITDAEGNAAKGPDGRHLVRWFWVYRAVDPDELIAQTIVTADLLDWLRTVAVVRLLKQGRHLRFRAEPKPLDLRRRTSPGVRFRIPLDAVPLPPEAAEELLASTDPE